MKHQRKDAILSAIAGTDIARLEELAITPEELRDDYSGQTLLAWAAHNDSMIPSAKWLLSRGVEVNAEASAGGYTALMAAAEMNQLEMMQFLVDNGANINAVSEYGLSPLMVAAVHQKVEAFALLLAVGADTSLVSAQGDTVRDMLARLTDNKPDEVFSMSQLFPRAPEMLDMLEAEEQNRSARAARKFRPKPGSFKL